jgi:hypothetical protein
LQHGWKTELYSLTKCDVACREIPGIQRFVQPVFNYICQAINVLYGTSRLMVDKNQPHVLKYSAAMGHTGGKRMENNAFQISVCRIGILAHIFVSFVSGAAPRSMRCDGQPLLI